MMKETETFLRTEEKFDLTEERDAVFLDEIKSYIVPDVYPGYTLYSLYYDTDDYAMISHCLNHPLYREKLRLRSYGVITIKQRKSLQDYVDAVTK